MYGLKLFDTGYKPVIGCSEDGNEPSGSLKDWEFSDHRRCYGLFKEESATPSQYEITYTRQFSSNI
jgi:hypothetical protein